MGGAAKFGYRAGGWESRATVVTVKGAARAEKPAARQAIGMEGKLKGEKPMFKVRWTRSLGGFLHPER